MCYSSPGHLEERMSGYLQKYQRLDRTSNNRSNNHQKERLTQYGHRADDSFEKLIMQEKMGGEELGEDLKQS